MYYYRLYGLITASEIPLPGAEYSKTLCDGNPDVTIRLYDVPENITDHPETVKLTDRWYYLTRGDSFLMHCDGCDFEIIKDSEIKVCLGGSGVDTNRLCTYILGSAFGVICSGRGYIPIHGAAVETARGAAIITGFSGSGKSAVLSSLVQRGCRYLTDDVAAVAVTGGIPRVLPSYPQRKIAVQTAAELGTDISSAVMINEDGNEKYAVRCPEEWRRESLTLSKVIEIMPAVKADKRPFTPEVTEIRGHAAMKLILRNLYRRHFYVKTGISPGRMKQILEIASAVEMRQLIRPAEGYPAKDTAELVENLLGAV